MSALSRPEFHSEEAAFAHLERVIWNGAPVCPHCGGVDRITSVKANPAKRIRHGLHRCGDCKRQFTVKIGTVFEHMRLPLHKAMQAVYLVTSSKKGISAHQLHRTLEITYKSAWFLLHRIREAMRSDDFSPFGGNGGCVEVDETFIGHLKGVEKRRAFHHKMKVLALLDRDSGKARTMVIEDVKAETLMPIVLANVVLYTTVCLEIWMLASHSIAAMVGVYALIIMISGLLVRWMLQILGPEDHGLDYEPEPAAAAAVEAKGRPAVIAHQPILH